MNKEFKHIRVMVVDDTAFMRSTLSRLLQELGFNKENIIQFENGRHALERLKTSEEKFDLVLSDWNMPNLNGLDFLKLVRASNSDYKKIPFVLITTVSEKEKVVEAILFQVNGYLLKPLEMPKFKETIDSIYKIAA